MNLGFRLIQPLLRALPPEDAHQLTITAISSPFFRPKRRSDPKILAVNLYGLVLSNPLGLAAGFDKNAVLTRKMLSLGFGFVEVGTVTPLAQGGNPKPRVFRLAPERAVINRLGFNNRGMEAATLSLIRARSKILPGPIGINIGANKDSPDRLRDYELAITRLAPLADFLVINISSPNTPGLRDLQRETLLRELIATCTRARASLKLEKQPPLFVKIAPDLDEGQAETVVGVAIEFEIAGLVITNTTTARPDSLVSKIKNEVGGLSGKPLFEPSTALLKKCFKLSGGKLSFIGVGGISSGADAYQKILAGASLVELYTALAFEGPDIINRIKDELAEFLVKDGFRSVGDAVGALER